MTNIRLQREHEHSLSAAVRTWFGAAAGAINSEYRDKRHERLRQHHKAFDDCRAELSLARASQPRDDALIERLQSRLRELKVRPLPDMSDLETERLAAVQGLDAIMSRELASIRNRAGRGELDTRLEWDAAEQRFVIPNPEPAHA